MANSKAIEAGGAYVRLFSDDSQLVRGLKSARREFDNWAAGITKAGLALTGVASSGFAGGTFAVKSFADMGSALNDMAARTGVSVEELSGLKYAAEQNSSSLETLELKLRKYSKTAVDATRGNKDAVDAFNAIGISIAELNGMTAGEQLALIGTQLDKVPEGARRSAAAMAIFGKSGTDILPVLKDLKTNMDRSKELGLGWTTEEAELADAVGDRFDDLNAVLKRTVQVVGSELAPAVLAVTKPLLKMATATREWSAENPGVIQNVALATAGVAALGATLITVGTGLSIAGMAAGGFSTAIASVGAVTGTVLSPLTAIASATGSLGGIAGGAVSGYMKLSKGITSTVVGGVGQMTQLVTATKSAASKAAKAMPSIPLSTKTSVSAGKAYIHDSRMDSGDTYRIAGSAPVPKPGMMEKLLKSRTVKPYAKAGKDLKKSADLFTQVIVSPFTSTRTKNAFGKLGPAIGKAAKQAFSGNIEGAGATAGKAGQRLGKALWKGFDTKRNDKRLSSAGGALASGLGKLGKAGMGSGVAATKAAFGGLQAVVTPLIGSVGSLTGAIRGGFNSAGNSVLRFGGSLAAAFAPVLAIGAIAGIGYVIATQTDIGKNAVNGLKSSVTIALDSIGIAGDELSTRMTDAWNVISTEAVAGSGEMVTAYDGVVDAVAAGDLGLAGEVALAGLESAWRTGAATIIDTWDVTVSGVMSLWTDTVAGVQTVGENLVSWFSSIWLDIKGFAFDAFDSIMNKWDSTSGWLSDRIIDISVDLGLLKGDAEEIKQTRREDTSRRQQSRTDAVGKREEDRTQQQAEIERKRQEGIKEIEAKRQEEQQRISDERDQALVDNEKKKIAAQEKLAALRSKAGEAKAEADKAAEDAKKDQEDKDDKAGLPFGGPGGSGSAGTMSGLVSSLNREIGIPALKPPSRIPSIPELRMPTIAPPIERTSQAQMSVGISESVKLLTAVNEKLGKLIDVVEHGGTLTA